jgi:putative flippase GtrA
VTFNRIIALFLLLMASAWVALVNGQPLFMADSTAYVRGPDFAAVYFLGPKFATSWTQQRTLQGLERHQVHDQSNETQNRETGLNSPFDKAIMAGRSIYYGTLLYLSHLTSYLWLAVFAQAAVFLYLSYTLVFKCLRLSFFTFECVTLTILVATPLSFFISFLMPDVFASFLILGLATLVGFWSSLRLRDQAILFSIILYSALTHTSHLFLLIIVASIFALICFFTERKAAVFGSLRKRLIVMLALSLTGILGEFAFSYGAQHTIGTDPIRPPFVMARIIADGPGYQFLQKNCATKTYTVCKYVDRLPVSSDIFLWSTNPTEGVFNVADLPTRIALSSEQTSFLIDVFRFDPVSVITKAAKNFFRQFFMTGLDELFVDQQRLQSFKEKLPGSYFAELLRSRIVLRDWLLVPLNVWYSSIYFLSTLALLLTCAFWRWIRFQRKSEIFPQPQWTHMLTIVVVAIVSNAAICGILSEPAPRYQTRISWIPLFFLFLIAASLWETFSAAMYEPEFSRRLAKRMPRLIRFLGIGGIGLASDLGIFTVVTSLGSNVFVAQLGSLAISTLVTWRLNRALTFDPSGRRQHEEAVRYAIVTVTAQGTSYAIFAALVLTALSALPQIAIVVGAVISAAVSYNGHRLLSFAPKTMYSSK